MRPCALLLSFVCLSSIAIESDAAVVHIIGDSTAATYPVGYPTKGWGQKIGEFFGAGVTVDNRALGGYSAKGYLDGNMYAGVVWPGFLDSVNSGDWVLINLGINDAADTMPERYSTPEEFRLRLGTMASDIRTRNAEVIFLTRAPLRYFYDSTLLVDRVYSNAMIDAAVANNVDYLDLNADMASLYTSIGPDVSKTYGYLLSDGVTWDTIHFNDWSSREVAALIASEIKSSNPAGLGAHVVPEPGVLLLAPGLACLMAGRRRELNG